MSEVDADIEEIAEIADNANDDDDEFAPALSQHTKLIHLGLLHDPLSDVGLGPERTAVVESVLRILEQGFQQLKLSLILPKAFENPLTMRQYLGGTQFEPLVALLETYVKDRVARKNEQTNADPEQNLTTVKIVDEFLINYKILDKLPDWLGDIGTDNESLLQSFAMLQNVTEVRLRKAAVDELKSEKKIHLLYYENEKMKKNIKDLNKKVKERKINLRWKLVTKNIFIKKLEEELISKKLEIAKRVQQEVASSGNRIRKVYAASAFRIKELEEELEKAKQIFEKTQAKNLAQEKVERDEKNKALLQLQTLLKKYDQTIGDKRKELISLQEQFELMKVEFDQFLIYYQKEEKQYERIVVQKQEEERQNQQRKMMRFMMNRAAIVIQRWWRDLIAKAKKAKKKAAKGKRK